VYVLDASVVIKWFVEEDDSERALRFWEQARAKQINMVAPDFLLYEVANILVRKKHFEVRDAVETINLLVEMGFVEPALDVGLLSGAMEVAAATGISVYDACYVALTRNVNGTLVTADRRLAKAVGSLAEVRLLSDL
jgi:predicted nucleic acid-binding protein